MFLETFDMINKHHLSESLQLNTGSRVKFLTFCNESEDYFKVDNMSFIYNISELLTRLNQDPLA